MIAPEILSSFLILRSKACTLAKRRESYGKRVRNTRRFAEWLIKHPLDDRARAWGDELSRCASHLWFRQFYTHEDQPTKLTAGYFCRRPLACPFCASRRAAVSIGRTVPKVLACLDRDGELRPYLLTLTCKNRETIQESYRELMAAYRRVMQERRHSGRGRHALSVWADFVGGVMSCEVKRGKESKLWHIHLHAVVLGKRDLTGPGGIYWREPFGNRDYARGPLSEAWSNLLGYDANCDLKPLNANVILDSGGEAMQAKDTLTHDLCEVFKYAMKPAGLKPADRWAACLALFGKRLVRSFGILRGCKEIQKYTDDVKQFQNLPFEETCWQYLDGVFVDVDLRSDSRWEFEHGSPFATRRTK
ncbi:MAG: protein rep [Planctomycetes bacterium]|nr:protein rep [Planctomycetota bacterium]